MAESTVWRVMHPDGSRTVVGHYPLALAYAKNDRSRIDEITLDLHPGPLKRELAVLRGVTAYDDCVQEAEVRVRWALAILQTGELPDGVEK